MSSPSGPRKGLRIMAACPLTWRTLLKCPGVARITKVRAVFPAEPCLTAIRGKLDGPVQNEVAPWARESGCNLQVPPQEPICLLWFGCDALGLWEQGSGAGVLRGFSVPPELRDQVLPWPLAWTSPRACVGLTNLWKPPGICVSKPPCWLR